VIGHGFWGGPGWGILGFLLMVAFWTLVVIIVVGLVRGRGPGGAPGVGTGALRILEERYARGEMSREEFLERRAVLTGRPAEPGEPTEPNPPATPPA
jgi:putative membrane protein